MNIRNAHNGRGVITMDLMSCTSQGTSGMQSYPRREHNEGVQRLLVGVKSNGTRSIMDHDRPFPE